RLLRLPIPAGERDAKQHIGIVSIPADPAAPSHEHLPSPLGRSRVPLLCAQHEAPAVDAAKTAQPIMSDQKRRNAIRDGGRPNGEREPEQGKGQSKGKSGVLFRAVEYVKWLEEGRQALHAEVLRVEAAAGL
ncbi:unnamed protein product, partial [Mycena citricolor]